MKALLGIAKAAPATLFRRPARLKVVTPGLSPPPPMSSVAKLLRRARERELPRAPPLDGWHHRNPRPQTMVLEVQLARCRPLVELERVEPCLQVPRGLETVH